MYGDIDREFHLDRPETIEVTPWDLASEIIHSAYLVYSLGDDHRMEGLYLCSFRKERVRLLHFCLADYLQLLDDFARNEVHYARQWIDPASGKMIVSRK